MNELSLRSVVSIDRTTGSFSTIAQEIVVPKEEDTNGRERQTDRQTDRRTDRERERERERERNREKKEKCISRSYREFSLLETGLIEVGTREVLRSMLPASFPVGRCYRVVSEYEMPRDLSFAPRDLESR